MIRPTIILLLVFCIPITTAAQDSPDQICTTTIVQPHMIQDCNNSNYQQLIREKAYQAEQSLDEKLSRLMTLIDQIDRDLRISLSTGFIGSAQSTWDSLYDNLTRYKERVIRERSDIGSRVQECMINEFKFQLLGPRLSYLDGELMSFCQFYNQARMQRNQRSEYPPQPIGLSHQASAME